MLWSRDGLRKKNESVSMQMSLTCGGDQTTAQRRKGGVENLWMRDEPVFEGVPECNHFRLGDDPHEVDSLEDFVGSCGDVRWHVETVRGNARCASVPKTARLSLSGVIPPSVST